MKGNLSVYKEFPNLIRRAYKSRQLNISDEEVWNRLEKSFRTIAPRSMLYSFDGSLNPAAEDVIQELILLLITSFEKPKKDDSAFSWEEVMAETPENDKRIYSYCMSIFRTAFNAVGRNDLENTNKKLYDLINGICKELLDEGCNN